MRKGGGGNILEDARHWIGLLQYNLSTGVTHLTERASPFMSISISANETYDLQPRIFKAFLYRQAKKTHTFNL